MSRKKSLGRTDKIAALKRVLKGKASVAEMLDSVHPFKLKRAIVANRNPKDPDGEPIVWLIETFQEDGTTTQEWAPFKEPYTKKEGDLIFM